MLTDSPLPEGSEKFLLVTNWTYPILDQVSSLYGSIMGTKMLFLTDHL